MTRSTTVWLATVLLLAGTRACAAPASTPLENWRAMRYGFFVHYVWDGAGTVTRNADGSPPTSIDDLCDRFDAQGFADDIASMGVEYLVFTAWHANLYPLFPSAAIERIQPGRSPRRDLLGDMIDAVKAKGVRVFFYTHPEQPVFGLDYDRWNDFLNDLYGEIATRYGSRLDGLYLDENSITGDMDRREDFPRLERTIRSRAPHLMLMQNFYGNMYCADVGVGEYTSFTPGDPLTWGVSSYQGIAHVMSRTWSAQVPRGQNAVPFTPEGMFRFTVLQAGTCLDGGGVFWAAGPYPGGGWEDGVLPTMQRFGQYIAAVAPSIKNTCASTSYPTPTGTSMGALEWGVATRSTDDSLEYIHVLKPPPGRTLRLSPPADGKVFGTARLLPSQQAVTLVQDTDGVRLTLPDGEDWSPLDTVIELGVTGHGQLAPGALRVTQDINDSDADAVSYGTLVTLNDTDPAISYVGGSWTHATGRDMGELNADIHYARDNGDYFVLEFTGTGVEFLSDAGGGRGLIDFYIDDELRGTADMSQGAWARNRKFWAVGLPPGRHTLKGVKRSGTYMETDVFLIYAPGQGAWQRVQAPPDEAIQGGLHRTAANGDYFELTFTGTGVDLISAFGPDGGTVDFYMDGALVRRANHYSHAPQAKATTFSMTGLAPGRHTLVGVKKSRQALDVDAFRVYR